MICFKKKIYYLDDRKAKGLFKWVCFGLFYGQIILLNAMCIEETTVAYL